LFQRRRPHAAAGGTARAGVVSRQAAARPHATADRLAHLAARLTPRDLWLCELLEKHRMLTTHQMLCSAGSAGLVVASSTTFSPLC
jgi:hypothetical protein